MATMMPAANTAVQARPDGLQAARHIGVIAGSDNAADDAEIFARKSQEPNFLIDVGNTDESALIQRSAFNDSSSFE